VLRHLVARARAVGASRAMSAAGTAAARSVVGYELETWERGLIASAM
jgi:hypothetical protein